MNNQFLVRVEVRWRLGKGSVGELILQAERRTDPVFVPSFFGH
jgi:hypothetical protein